MGTEAPKDGSSSKASPFQRLAAKDLVFAILRFKSSRKKIWMLCRHAIRSPCAD
jgi:hypothetical protein